MGKFRARLSPAEEGLFDLMLNTSDLLKGLAVESSEELASRPPDEHAAVNNIVYLHDVVTYAFTLGVQFAVNRQQEVARQVAKKMGLLVEDSTKKN